MGDVEAVLTQAVDLAANCARTDAPSEAAMRRQWNEAFFNKLLIRDDEVTADERAAPFDDLTDLSVTSRTSNGQSIPAQPFFYGPWFE